MHSRASLTARARTQRTDCRPEVTLRTPGSPDLRLSGQRCTTRVHGPVITHGRALLETDEQRLGSSIGSALAAGRWDAWRSTQARRIGIIVNQRKDRVAEGKNVLDPLGYRRRAQYDQRIGRVTRTRALNTGSGRLLRACVHGVHRMHLRVHRAVHLIVGLHALDEGNGEQLQPANGRDGGTRLQPLERKS